MSRSVVSASVSSTRRSRLYSSIRELSAFQAISLLIGLLLAAIAVGPLLRATVGLFIDQSGITIKPLLEALAVPNVGGLILNTVFVVVGSSAAAMLIGGSLAWLNERTDARLGVLTDSLPLIPFLLPPVAGTIGWVLLLSPHGGFINAVIRWFSGLLGIDLGFSGPLNIYSTYGMMFVYMLYQVPYAFMLISSGLRNADSSLDEQSRVCGAGRLRTFLHVTFPAVRQSISGAWLLMMMVGFSMFAIPFIIGAGTNINIVSVKIVSLMTSSYPPQIGVAVGLGFVLVVFVGATWLWQLRILHTDRYSTLSGKGQRSVPIKLGRSRWLGRLALLSYGVVAVVLPLIALVLVSLNGYWSTNIKWASLGLQNFFKYVFADRLTLISLGNSMWIGVAGATIGMVAAALFAVFMRRSSRRSARVIIDGAVKLPSVFPHVVIGVGFVLVFSGPPFNLGGTTLILFLAYLAIYLPQGSIAADSAISQVGHELSEASSVSGAGEGRTFRKIYLPLMLPGLVAGWTFLFARVIGDLTATALLSGPTNTVVGFRIMQIFTNGAFADLASVAVALVVVSSVVVSGALILARRFGRWRTGGRLSDLTGVKG